MVDTLNGDEREIIDFLHRVAEDGRYERRVYLLRGATGHGHKSAPLHPEPVGPVSDDPIEAIRIDPDDAFSLQQRGYIESSRPLGGKGLARVALSRKGRLLRDNGYVEIAEAPSAGQTQNNYILGQAAIAQTQDGNITQQVGASPDLAEIAALLDDLREAVGQLGIPQEDREDYAEQISQLRDAVSAPAPRRAKLLMLWVAIQTFATVESTIQGAERVQLVLQRLGPHMGGLLQALH